MSDQDYFALRERIEREAAERSPSETVRRVHQELARGYGVLAKRCGSDTELGHIG